MLLMIIVALVLTVSLYVVADFMAGLIVDIIELIGRLWQ